MEKFCKNCHSPISSSERFCEKCGTEIGKEEQPTKKGSPSSLIDNTLQYNTHKGDKHVVEGDNITDSNIDNSVDNSQIININDEKQIIGGDNISTSHVDNRVVTDNSQITNIHNVQTILDESSQVVTCEISGISVKIVNSAICPKCKRRVSLECYSKTERMCIDCAKEVRQLDSGRERGKIPPLFHTDNTEVSTPRPIVEPIRNLPEPPTPSRKKLFIVIGVVALIVIGIGGFALSNKSGPTEKAVETPTSSEGRKAAPTTTKKTTANVKQEATIAESIPSEAKATTEPAAKKVNTFDEGVLAYNSGNFAKANLLFKEAGQSGYSGAYYYLAQMYRKGEGVTKSVQNAFANMLKAAETGYEEAYYEVAEMYRSGNGVEPNREIAQKWYEKAAVSNSTNANKASNALTKYYR